MPLAQLMSTLVLAHLALLGALPSAVLFLGSIDPQVHTAAGQLLVMNFWPAQCLQPVIGHRVPLTDAFLGLPTSAGMVASLIFWLFFYLAISLALRRIRPIIFKNPS